ncbi:phage tail protein [Paenibacillus melissococcoides]|uniref:Phage tail protein n=3 Tax=Paenibacillus TaxID=44249 RepID=A0ABN8UEB8_9BACL|nr:phage tail protein [Paenibacillus melissococcoides]QVQ56207.1 tail protein [Paenibacillus phage Pd_22F]CAH8248543.1 phage tail protein [Paenibacillus melissococcoides]CAH8714434.1 phage tail protein [Paenibacillus melissococcoides]CAH8719779.1 phage tail protein [Paenibacillus melissococcoides]
MIGSLGPINFLVTAHKIRTFDNFSRSGEYRFAEIEVLGKSPVLQPIGPGLDEARLTIRLDYLFGINVRNEVSQLTKLHRAGKPHALTIGGSPIGRYRWVITHLEQAWERIDAQGRLLTADIDIQLKEYLK